MKRGLVDVKVKLLKIHRDPTGQSKLVEFDVQLISSGKIIETTKKRLSRFPKSKKKKGMLSQFQFRLLIFTLILCNIVVGGYLSLVHQRAPISVISYLREEAVRWNNKENKQTWKMSVHFLTPCHATPFYSQIHVNIPMRLLDCSPPGMLSSVISSELDRKRSLNLNETTESDRFQEAPIQFVKEFYGVMDDFAVEEAYAKENLPSHIVMFSNHLDRKMKSLLEDLGFQQVNSFFHSHVQGDRHAKGPKNASIILFRLSDYSK
eukprot:g1913.t1